MHWRDFDLEVFLEVGHVFSNVHERCLANETSAPGTPVDGSQHEVFTPSTPSGGGDHILQFSLMDDERLAQQTQAAALIQQNKFWAVGVVDVDHQGQLSNPRGCVALGTRRKPLADVRIQNERIPFWQQTHATLIAQGVPHFRDYFDSFAISGSTRLASQSPLCSTARRIVTMQRGRVGRTRSVLRCGAVTPKAIPLCEAHRPPLPMQQPVQGVSSRSVSRSLAKCPDEIGAHAR
jgi:hypothetical protein